MHLSIFNTYTQVAHFVRRCSVWNRYRLVTALRIIADAELRNTGSVPICAKELQEHLTVVRELLTDSSIRFVFSALAQSVIISVIWLIMLFLWG